MSGPNFNQYYPEGQERGIISEFETEIEHPDLEIEHSELIMRQSGPGEYYRVSIDDIIKLKPDNSDDHPGKDDNHPDDDEKTGQEDENLSQEKEQPAQKEDILVRRYNLHKRQRKTVFKILPEQSAFKKSNDLRSGSRSRASLDKFRLSRKLMEAKMAGKLSAMRATVYAQQRRVFWSQKNTRCLFKELIGAVNKNKINNGNVDRNVQSIIHFP